MTRSLRGLSRATLLACMVPGAACVVAVAGAPTAARAQASATSGIITGRVVDRGTNGPVAGAQVRVVGTSLGTVTGPDGAFRIAGVPAGTVQVQARRLGYSASTQSIAVTAGGTTTSNFTLGRAEAQTLEQVIVTATGAQQTARETGNIVSRVTPDSTPLAAVQNVSQLLQGRAAGVVVTQSSGTSGSGSRVRIRGGNSLSLSNEPLLIIDGVRINNEPNSSSLDVGGQSPSRLNDLKPEDIETIEILKGPAATGLYGTQAANGVIQVTTKGGSRGRPQYNTFVEGGAIRDPFTYPANQRAYGVNANGGIVTRCLLSSLATGACVRQDSVQAFSPLEDPRSTPFRTGRRQRYGASAAGGGNTATYYLSGDYEDENGIYRSSGLERVNLRSNVRANFGSKLDGSLNLGYLNSDIRRASNDNNDEGIISGGFLGGTSYNERTQGYLRAGPSVLDQLETRQTGDRLTGSGQLNFRPLSWLAFNAVTGFDVLNRDDQQLLPPNVFTAALFDSDRGQGRRFRNKYRIATYTANGSGVATYTLPFDVTSVTTAGVQFQRERTDGTEAYGYNLLAGSGNLSGTNSRFQIAENNPETRLFGALVSQRFGFRDRLFLEGSVRGDNTSAFGQDVGFIVYPSANASYVLSDESFFPKTAYLSSVRLRAATGQSGQRPLQRSALQFFTPVAVSVDGADVPGFTPGNLGNRSLRPEITRESELGVDLTMFRQRAQLEVTYFSRRTRDQLVNVPLAPSLGLGPGGAAFQQTNIGTVTNKGLEALLTTTLVRRERVGFEVAVNAATLANKIVSLRDTTPIVFGIGGASQVHRVGYPAGSYTQPTYAFADTVGGRADGLLAIREVSLGDGAIIGNPLPKFTLAVSPTLSLGRNGLVRITSMLDYRAGFYQYDATTPFRCQFQTCAELYDRSTPVDRQAAAVAARLGSDYGWIQRADFVKLRELAVTVRLPQRVLGPRLRDANLTFAGRNLALFSDYTGLDPETQGGGQANWSQFDFLSQPPARLFSARLTVNF
jgi:TonB-linked SusC/RagA family outer membrane protein